MILLDQIRTKHEESKERQPAYHLAMALGLLWASLLATLLFNPATNAPYDWIMFVDALACWGLIRAGYHFFMWIYVKRRASR